MRSLDPIYFAPQRKADGSWLCFKDSPSAPPAPDYTGAAIATSQGSVQAAIANQLLNQRRTTTPLGTQDFTQIGTTQVPGVGGQPGFELPRYEQNISMTPEGQALYDQQMGLSTGLMGLGQSSLDQTTASLGQPQEHGSVQDIEDSSYGLQASRLDTQWAQNEQSLDAKLAAQGIPLGSEAHANAMREFNQGRNDAYNQARLSSIGTMPQTYQLSTAQRMQPLTELNAIRTGAQPQMPQFQGVPAAGGVQGPNMLGAAQSQSQYGTDVYNQEVAGNNSMMSGLFGLGAAGMKMFGPSILASDIRLKSKIERIGTHRLGIGIYEYDIFGKRERGVMAQEVLTVMPEAVVEHPDGYLMVDYGRL